MRIPRGRRIATALLAWLLLAGCGAAIAPAGDAAGDALSEDPERGAAGAPPAGASRSPEPALTPARVVETAIADQQASRRGHYIERRMSQDQTLLTRWVRYDRTVPVQIHRFGLHENGRPAPTEDDPDLIVRVTPGETLMRNEQFTAPCGTPWVELTEQAATAVDLTRDAIDPNVVDVYQILTVHAAEATQVGEGRYAMPVPVLDVLPMTQQRANDPAINAALDGVESTAEVVVGGGSVDRLTVDVSEAVGSATGQQMTQGDLVFEYTFPVEPGRPAAPIERPTRIADASCLNG